MRERERLADQHFVGRPPAAGRGAGTARSAAAVRAREVEISRPVAGSSTPGMSSVTSTTTRGVTRATPGSARRSSTTRSGARLSVDEHIGKAEPVVVGLPRARERVERAEVRHEHRHARGDDERDGDRLAACGPEIPQQLS